MDHAERAADTAPAARPSLRVPKRLVGDGHRAFGSFTFALLAIVLGLGAGLGALVFRVLIALVHNLAFFGALSTRYDTSLHTGPSVWGHAVVLVPVLGGTIVVFLVRTFAPEARGHGVPEVMDAIYYSKSVIRPVVAVVKSVASAISIGTGGSVGREGPIVQISAAFASWLGGRFRVSRWQRATLVAAGGGAGIAATFNTPIGGVLFAVEVLMHEVSARTLVPVAIATATATYVGRRFFGNTPAFEVPAVNASASAAVLPAYMLLGVVMAFVSVAFIGSLYGAEDWLERAVPKREYLRHASGMLAVGATFEVLMTVRGHYYVQGVGYSTIVDVLTGRLAGAGWLLALGALKLWTTCLTLGSGGSGGVFSPSLFMGATVGAAFGMLLQALFPSIPFDPAAMALAGMAGLVAGATGAALTAIVMIFEMTLDYGVVLPLTLTVAVSHGVRRMLLAQNIYTMKLARRGHYMPEALQANAHLVHHVGDMTMATAVSAPAAACVDDLSATPGADYWVVFEGEDVLGILANAAARERPRAAGDATLRDLARRDVVVVSTETTVFDLIAAMQRAGAEYAVVLTSAGTTPEPSRVRGVVTKTHVAEALAEGMEIFQD